MRVPAPLRSASRTAPLLIALAALVGCAQAPAPRGAPIPPVTAPSPTDVLPTGTIVGETPDAREPLYDLRFAQTLPASARFNFRDRDLSFYFRPRAEVLDIQIQNLQNRPVWIDWDRSVFRDPVGRSGKTAHGTTRWKDRFSGQAQTPIAGLQTYSDYLFPMDYLLDPAGSEGQLHRPIIPLDTGAPQYSEREFGVDLVFLIEDQPRNYSFRFKVVSVIPRSH